MAYEVSATEGFRLVGRIPSPGGSMPKRTIVMDDYVVTIFDRALRVSPLAALSQTATEVALPD